MPLFQLPLFTFSSPQTSALDLTIKPAVYSTPTMTTNTMTTNTMTATASMPTYLQMSSIGGHTSIMQPPAKYHSQ